jgi:hypothetical protein
MLTPTRQMRVWACAEPVNMGNYAELAVMQSKLVRRGINGAPVARLKFLRSG